MLDLDQYTLEWAGKQFGAAHANEIAGFIAQYTKFNGRRKPEMIDSLTYNLHNYREWERVVSEYNDLAAEAQALYEKISEAYKDAYYQLVLFPILACANLNELHYTVAKNQFYARQGRTGTNTLASRAKDLFRRDSMLTYEYNHILAGGKWSHMMDQTHIGYTYWQQPEKNIMPEVKYIDIPAGGNLGIYAEGERFTTEGMRIIPESTPFQKTPHYIELYNTGQRPLSYQVSSPEKWLHISDDSGLLDDEIRLHIHTDWDQVPPGRHTGILNIESPQGQEQVLVLVHRYQLPSKADRNTFVENDGHISIEAIHYSEPVERQGITWRELPDHGRTHSAMTAFPVISPSIEPDTTLSPHLVYRFYTHDHPENKKTRENPEISINWYVSPTLTFNGTGQLRFAVSVDGEQPQIININKDQSEAAWEKAVGGNIRILTSQHQSLTAGHHDLRFWFVDPGVVLQKIVIDLGGEKPSYLGPPESPRTGVD